MKYVVRIDDDSKDNFEWKADNVIRVKIQDEETNPNVMIFASKNAMIGLGTELIRMAYAFEEGKHMHLEPSNADMQVQRMGVFLTPDSNSVIVCCEDMESIDEYVNM